MGFKGLDPNTPPVPEGTKERVLKVGNSMVPGEKEKNMF
jgi:hypothetical protein